jgi:hypothetical protein
MLRSTTAFAGLRRSHRFVSTPRRLFSASAQAPRAFLRPSRLLLLVVPGALLAAACTTSVSLDAPPTLSKIEDVVGALPHPISLGTTDDDGIVDADSGIEFPRILKVRTHFP